MTDAQTTASDSSPAPALEQAVASEPRGETSSSGDRAPRGPRPQRKARGDRRDRPERAERSDGREASARRERPVEPRRDHRGRRLDLSPPRFNVDELAALAGAPLWQAVHDAAIVEVTPAAVVVEVRPAGHATLKALVRPEELSDLTVGRTLRVRLLDPPTAGEMLPFASVRQARDLGRFEEMQKSAEVEGGVKGAIVREVKGGYAVALFADEAFDVADGAVRAFLPASQATLGRYGPSRHEKVVGLTGHFQVAEVDLERANLVVSRRAILEAARDAETRAKLASLKEGDVVQGRVTSIAPYGAFVDVGGLDGLLHRDDLSWDGRGRIDSFVKVGEVLDVKVLQLKDTKLKVGLKQLKPDPWAEVRAAFAEGSIVKGIVVGLADFGAFVKLPIPSNPAEHVEGLIHISEVSYAKIKHPSSKFQIGQEIDVKVLGLDTENRRMSLSTKALEKNPFEAIAEQFPVGAVLKAKVKSLTEFGAFVALSETVDGLVHIGEISWTEHPAHPSELLTIGAEVEIVVLNVDVAKQRVSCSMKRTQENPFDAWEKKYKTGSRHKLKVVQVNDKGASLEVEKGLSCFCFFRDLLDKEGNAVERGQDAVKIGETIEVEVRQFDRKFKKVSVSMKAVVEGETRAAYDEYKAKEQGSQKLNPLADKLKALADRSAAEKKTEG
jgi:small subunit ribosomal protein S1